MNDPIPAANGRLHRLLLLAGCAGVGCALAVFVLIGTTSRYSGDDYCYGALFSEYGFWRAQVMAHTPQATFHGNRFSLTFFSSLGDWLGPGFNAAFPGLVIGLWTACAWLGLRALGRDRASPDGLESLLLAGAFVALCLHTSPDLPQTLYWRSGMLPYLAPVVAATACVAWMLVRRAVASPSLLDLAVAFSLALIAGGFSETAGVLLSGLWIGWAGARIARARRGPPPSPGLTRMVVAACGGGAAALLLLALSPRVFVWMAEDGLGVPASPIGVLFDSGRHAFGFVRGTLQGAPLPTLVSFVLPAALAAMAAARSPVGSPAAPAGRVRHVLAAASVVLLLIALGMLPSVWARAGAPGQRALMPARAVMTLGLFVVGWWTGDTLMHWMRPHRRLRRLAWTGVVLTLAACALYPVHVAWKHARTYPRYQTWAAAWDARHAIILQARAQGELDLHVMELDHIIPWVGELAPDPLFWYNDCAARYYGVRSITADLPGWDDLRRPRP